jgi:hypothetical protein
MGVLLSLAAPTSAYAWTDASVQTVRAVVDIDRHAVAHVTLVAKVRVHGGWLTDFEVDGLDPDLDLDGQGTPWATDEAGVGYTPAVTRVSEGRVRVSFERRNAPRRGICEIGFHYRTVLAHRATAPSNEGQSIRVRWTLPAWQTGLDGVTLAVSVPGRAEDVYTDDEERDVATVQRTFEHGKTTLTYRRVHLPRTTPWAVEIDTPQAAMDASLGSTRQARAGTHHEELPSWPFRLGLGLLLVLLCVAKERLTVRNYANVRAIVKMPALLRGLFLVAALTSASISDRVNALVPAVSLMAVVLLGLVRSDEPLLERTPPAHTSKPIVAHGPHDPNRRALLRRTLYSGILRIDVARRANRERNDPFARAPAFRVAPISHRDTPAPNARRLSLDDVAGLARRCA